MKVFWEIFKIYKWKINFLPIFSPIIEELCLFIQLWKITPFFYKKSFSVSGGGEASPSCWRPCIQYKNIPIHGGRNGARWSEIGSNSPLRSWLRIRKSILRIIVSQGRSQGKGGFHPRNRKYCDRKMVLFPMALFLLTKLQNKK